jgi:hypothetical protein
MDENPFRWTCRIEGAELKQFDKDLHYDLPTNYGGSIGRNVLELKKYELATNRFAYHWSAHQRGKNKIFAVALEATHYTSNTLAINIERSVPVKAFMPAQVILNGIVINPWTQTEEEATFHGRKLIDWLCDWLENKFGVRPKSKLSDENLAEFESLLIQSPMPRTRERQREVSGQEAKANVLATENQPQTPPEQRHTDDHELTNQEKRRTSNKRERDIPMRIKTGLVQWAAKRTAKGPEHFCGKKGLPSLNTYYKYKQYGLLYEDQDITALGSAFVDIWGAHDRGKLDNFIQELLLPKK